MSAWWTSDPVQVARVDAVLRRFGARRALEAAHADVGLRFVPPVNSDLARWEAFWDGGSVAADTDAGVYTLVCERLGGAE